MIAVGSLWKVDTAASQTVLRVECEVRPGWYRMTRVTMSDSDRLEGCAIGDGFEVELEWFRRRGVAVKSEVEAA